MDHYSLEVIGKEKQRNLLQGELHERSVRRNGSRNRIRAGRLVFLILTFLLLYFWLFI